MNNKSRFKTLFFSLIPFVLFGFYGGITRNFYAVNQPVMKILAIGFIAAALLLVVSQRMMKDRHYFPAAALIIFALLAIPLYLIPGENYSRVMLDNELLNFIYARPQVSLYIGMFLMALLLPLFRVPPFTEYFARAMTPAAFHGTKLFKVVNLYINYLWALLFALCAGTQFIPVPAMQTAFPIILQIAIGMPATRMLIPFLQARLAHVQEGEPRDYLAKAHDAISGMPYVFNKKEAAGVDAVFQFIISGREEFQGYLEVKNGTCAYHDGRHENPGMVIRSDAETWLRIARGELKGDEALIKKMYTVEGDLSNLMTFSRIFKPSSNRDDKKTGGHEMKDRQELFITGNSYSTAEPGSIRKVLVLQGSPRGKGTSKTEILTAAFAEGCAGAGAVVETVNLREKKISHCTGCYTCWTRTPGTCIFRDDAAEIMKKQQEADLVVYATPLYHFGIISIMKKYIERTLPILEPFLVTGKTGGSSHPMRGNNRPARAVIISVCGFPEAGHFRALSSNFHLMAETGNGMSIMGELYRPGSEILNNPFFTGENSRVLKAAEEAGRDCILKGVIDKSLMADIATMKIDRDEFIKQANMTWEQCIKEKMTLPEKQKEFIMNFAGSGNEKSLEQTV